MKAIHIREVSPVVLNSLKRLAEVHHRSLQAELHVILEQAARLAPTDEDDQELQLTTVATGKTSSWRREDMYAEDGR
jgi:hypothetical protein